MARSKTLTDPKDLNLRVSSETKEQARQLATKYGMSISLMFTFMIQEALGITPNPKNNK